MTYIATRDRDKDSSNWLEFEDGSACIPYVKWGTGFVDFDNDGWPDVFVASGHVYPQVDTIVNNSAGYRQPMFLFRNKGDRTFEDITALRDSLLFRCLADGGAAFEI